MAVIRYLVTVIAAVLLTAPGVWGNNIRIEGDVRVAREDVVENIATVRITVKWENSWRDAFNYDAAYIFLKYKVDGTGEVWHHLPLMNSGHSVKPAGDFGYVLANSNGSGGTQHRNEGIFIYRSGIGRGDATAQLELKWNITVNPDRVLNEDLFTNNSVFVSAMAIEMVYIPRGGFRAGDTQSDKKFEYGDVTLPASYDILGTSAVKRCFSSRETATNPPSFAINRMNDVTEDETNAWVGRVDAPVEEVDYFDYWQVEFNNPVRIRNFAIESIAGRVPDEWQLQGLSSGGTWQTLYPGSNENVYAPGTDWAVGSHQTYPCTRTLAIPNYESNYSTYRIRIKSMPAGVSPVIKNIAMTTENYLSFVDNSVVISEPTTKLDARNGLFARDEDTWSGVTDANYPNGYAAFFTMKYEVSQEQYVAFLNKLTAAQQRSRTIGGDLEHLAEGDYVFGSSRTEPNYRNGIKISRVGASGAPYVFANDLNSADGAYSQESDGQTIACNFLNAGDMLAYADWAGLRPLTELEYEKMARRPFLDTVVRGEYPWNRNTDYLSAPAIVSDGTVGTKDESVTAGNINAARLENGQAQLPGPVRVGAFAKSAEQSSQTAAGAGFWGVMELGGNLSEIYYNANTEGRAFRGIRDIYHGNGKLASNGQADVSSALWVLSENAFAVRGGNFGDLAARTRTSDRFWNKGVFANMNQVNGLRDSTLTFRLGYTAPVQTLASPLQLENGQTTDLALAVDSICSGSDYLIRGTLPSAITGIYRIAWFMSSDKGATWVLMKNEESPSLHLENLRNINSKEDSFIEYRYRRRIYSNGPDDTTNDVRLLVINTSLNIDRLVDTVDVYDYSQGIRVQAPQAATFSWTWIRESSGNKAITPQYPAIKANKIQRHYFKYADFFDGSQYTGDQKILLKVTVLGQCSSYDTVRLYVRERPVETNAVNNDAAKTANADFRCGDILVDNEENVTVFKKYRTVDIGGMCWFADNLNRTATNDIGASYCYGGDTGDCNALYGRLYNYRAATQNAAAALLTGTIKGICPTGWHLPSNAEWLDLLRAIGVNQNAAGNAVALQSPLNSWTNTTDENRIGTNSSRFSAQPSGGQFWYYTGSVSASYGPYEWEYRTGYADQGNRAWWWTSTVGSLNWHPHDTRSYAAMPYHVVLNNQSGTPVATELYARTIYTSTSATAAAGSYSVLTGRHHYYLARNYTNGAWNLTYNMEATDAMWSNFYFAVRCVKN